MDIFIQMYFISRYINRSEIIPHAPLSEVFMVLSNVSRMTNYCLQFQATYYAMTIKVSQVDWVLIKFKLSMRNWTS